MLSVYEITKKNQNWKAITRVNLEETTKTSKRQKQVNSGWEVNSVRNMNSARRNVLQLQILCIFYYSFLLVFDLQC